MLDAAARFRTPPKASVDCCASHPAKLIYFNASAASDALKTVVAPYCLAVSSIIARSLDDAPEIAATSDITDV